MSTDLVPSDYESSCIIAIGLLNKSIALKPSLKEKGDQSFPKTSSD